jgi:predicted transcriptional regulator
MKSLSLKLEDDIFEEAEQITGQLNMPRNRYINEAVKVYNLFNKRRLIQKQLQKESLKTRKESMAILREFERFMDED